VRELHKSSFPQVNRKFCDPDHQSEPRFALFSFIPAENVQPNQHGFYGVAKIRGAFFTSNEADERAEELIRNVDSTNSIFTCRIGAPIPLIARGKAENLSEIDLRQNTEKVISDNVRAKREQEKREIAEIEERSAALRKDVESVPDELDKYIEQRVKLAHLRYAIVEHTEKLEECKKLESKVRDILRVAAPQHENAYLEKYMKSRRDAHIPEDTDMKYFMKYICDPIDPPEQQ
jgi:hypothetical protein